MSGYKKPLGINVTEVSSYEILKALAERYDGQQVVVNAWFDGRPYLKWGDLTLLEDGNVHFKPVFGPGRMLTCQEDGKYRLENDIDSLYVSEMRSKKEQASDDLAPKKEKRFSLRKLFGR
jgi:hypothetical protein